MLRIKRLYLENFRGYRKASFSFGDFTCLIGENGGGKTTVLEAISLLCSSMDFGTEQDVVPSFGDNSWKPTITAETRARTFLKRNIRGIDDVDGAKSFLVEGVFERDGKEYTATLCESGFKRNDLLSEKWWWVGLTYFARFDSEMNSFMLPIELWPKFAQSYETITGIKLGIETQFDPGDGQIVVDKFWLYKPNGRISSKKASAGERKIGKALSQIVNLPPERMPDLILVDNMEMHVHHKRHLIMFDEIKRLFEGRQIVATTHSTVVIDQYEPKSHLLDVEQAHSQEACNG